MSYIKLDRKISDWEWFTDGNMLKVWIYLLTHANYKDSSFQGHEVNQGELIVGRKKLAECLKMSEQQIRTCLTKLETTGEITIKATNKFSLISIVKWADYQLCDDDSNQQINQQITNDQPTNNQQITTSKEIKKYKNIRNINIYSALDGRSEAFVNAFMEFADMRKRIKKPLTENTVKLTLRKLNSLSNDENEQIQILEQSSFNYWRGVFPLGHTTEKKKERYETW